MAFNEYKAKFAEALDNDINTSLAITAVYDVLKAKTNGATKRALIADFDKVLSLDLLSELPKKAEAAEKTGETDSEIDALVAERAEAKKNRDFAKADAIRDQLKARGIVLKDTAAGTTWTRE